MASKLSFNTRVDRKIKKCNKLVGLIRRIWVNLPQNASLTIYKSFIRPHLSYGDICLATNQTENFRKE